MQESRMYRLTKHPPAPNSLAAIASVLPCSLEVQPRTRRTRPASCRMALNSQAMPTILLWPPVFRAIRTRRVPASLLPAPLPVGCPQATKQPRLTRHVRCEMSLKLFPFCTSFVGFSVHYNPDYRFRLPFADNEIKRRHYREGRMPMTPPISRRDLLKAAGVGITYLTADSIAVANERQARRGNVVGHMTGADALVETLIAEGTDCVFGI